MIYHVLESALLALFETFVFFFLLDNLLSRKDGLKSFRIVCIISYLLFQLFTYVIDFRFFSTSFFYILFSVFITCSLYYDSLRVKLITTSLFVTLNYSAKLLATVFQIYLTHRVIPKDLFSIVLTGPTQFISCLIVLGVTALILFMRTLNKKPAIFFIDALMFLFPLADLFLCMNLLNQSTLGSIYLEITAVLFFYTFFLFFMIDQLLYASERNQRIEMMAQQITMQNQHYGELEIFNKQIHSIRHDMRNHLSIIQGYLEKPNPQEALHYVQKLSESLYQVASPLVSGNAIVDILLSQKNRIAKENKIELKTAIMIPPVLDIEELDLCILLGNLLDNSIEACQRCHGTWISLKINIYKDQLFIHIANPYNGEVRRSSSHYLSMKNNNIAHGFGLSNVARVCEKVRGQLDIQSGNEEFNVSLWLPILVKNS